MSPECPDPKPNDVEKRNMIAELYEKVRPSFPDVPEITAQDVMARRASGEPLILVDVRTPEEQSVSMIDGAITAEQFGADPRLADGTTVVCYCLMGARGGMYARQLRAAGVNAFNMPGAVLSWSHEGGPLANARGSTKRVHTHTMELNLLADGYEASA